MSVASQHEAVSGMVIEYTRVDRKEKGGMLDRLVTLTGYNRKCLIGPLVHPLSLPGSPRYRPRKRRRRYTERVGRVLRHLWEMLDCICGKRASLNPAQLSRSILCSRRALLAEARTYEMPTAQRWNTAAARDLQGPRQTDTETASGQNRR